MKLTDDEIDKKLNEVNHINDEKKALDILKSLIENLEDNTEYYLIILLKIVDTYEKLNSHENVINDSFKAKMLLLKYDYSFLKPEEHLYYMALLNIKMAYAYQSISQLQESINLYNEVITLFEKNPTLDNKLNLIFAHQGIGFIQAAISEYKKDQERYKLLEMAKEHYEKALSIDNEIYSIYPQLALIYNNLGNTEKAEKLYVDSILKPMNKQIAAQKINNVYYKYTKLDRYTIVDLINRKLYFNHPRNFNDPFDCPVYRGNNYRKHKSFSNVLDKIRVSCFSTKLDSILMWSHYANSHKGICIGYKIDDEYCQKNKLLFNEVDYQLHNYRNKDIKNFRGLLNETFLIKKDEWQYENEFRMIGYDMESDKISSPSIKEIIFGINTPDDDRKLIYQIFNDNDEIIFKEIRDHEYDTINMEIVEI